MNLLLFFNSGARTRENSIQTTILSVAIFFYAKGLGTLVGVQPCPLLECSTIHLAFTVLAASRMIIVAPMA